MTDELSSASTAEILEKCVEQRFGILPNFFRLAPETPEITEQLCYFIARHVAFLVGLDRPDCLRLRKAVADRCGIVPGLPTRIHFMGYCGVPQYVGGHAQRQLDNVREQA